MTSGCRFATHTPRIDCNTGSAACKEGQPASMKLVAVTPADEALRKEALVKAIMPGFAQRCGADCVTNWNATIGPSLGLKMGQ